MTVAIKQIRCRKQYIQHEIEFMQKLRHPRVMEILGVCSPGQCYDIVTEYMEKGSLHQWLKEREEEVTVKMLHKTAFEVRLEFCISHGLSIHTLSLFV